MAQRRWAGPRTEQQTRHEQTGHHPASTCGCVSLSVCPGSKELISDRFRLPHFRKQSHSLDVDWKPADSGSDMEVLGSFSRQRITHQDPPILLFNRSILQTVNRGVETTALSAPPCTAWSSCRACDPPGKTLAHAHSQPLHACTSAHSCCQTFHCATGLPSASLPHLVSRPSPRPRQHYLRQLLPQLVWKTTSRE